MTGKSTISEGDTVSWKWGNGRAKGRVKQAFKRKVSRTIKGHKIMRKASESDPAFLIKQKSGAKVLKSHSEVNKV